MEAVFFVIAVAVLVVEFICLWETRLNEVTARSSDERRQTVANADTEQAWFKFAIAIVMLLSAAAALFLEPPPPRYTQVPQTVVYTMAWIAVGVIMVTSSLIAMRVRRRLRQLAAESIAERNGEHP
jgi:hypothetical protein